MAPKMLMILSPAKTLDLSTATPNPFQRASAGDTAAATLPLTHPPLLKHTTAVAEHMRSLSVARIKSTLGISDNLAKTNHARYQSFVCGEAVPEDADTQYERAVLAYNGDAYCSAGMDARTFTKEEFEFAQGHLRIISGWYGVVRATDYIQPYRLCMGTKLSFKAGGSTFTDLYEYWKPFVTQQLLEELDGPEKLLVNLASVEYWKAVDEEALRGAGVRVLSCSFLNDGKSMSVYAKKARGLMCRFIIQQGVTTAEGLKAFNVDKYRFSASQSTDDHFVFTRPKPPPASAKKAAKGGDKAKGAVARPKGSKGSPAPLPSKRKAKEEADVPAAKRARRTQRA